MRILVIVVVLLFTITAGASAAAAAGPLQPAQLAIVVNDAEPNSVAIGDYYRRRRNIPAANVVHVSIPGKPHTIDLARFQLLRREIDGQLGPGIQAVLMIWTAPYRVGCNGITAAYTLGYDAAPCARTCAAGQPSPYFDAAVARPFDTLHLRLSMLLPTDSVAQARALIDRGVGAGFRTVPATAYYLRTSQAARNSRAALFPRPGSIGARRLNIRILRADALEGARDILIYQTGMATVPKLDTLGFVPGALADHLTSFGGALLDSAGKSGQMSSLRWLEAGATASYGTVSEPCNYWRKFPHPTVLLKNYVQGDSAIEAYWKSVAWPAQGLFIGEPLAAPYGKR